MRPILAVTCAAVALAACGVGGQTVSADATPGFLDQAADSTIAARTGHVDGTLTVGDVAVALQGDYDTTAGESAMSLDLSGMQPLFGAGTAPAGALLADPIDVVMADGVMYMRIPVLGDLLGDAEWVKLDLGDLAVSGADGSTADSLLGGSGVSSLSDPATYLDFLRGASSGITDEGNEEVHGVDTTHLHATIDIDKALAELTGTEYDALNSVRDSLGGLTDDLAMIPVDVWIDGDAHVRRFTASIALPTSALPGTDSTESTVQSEPTDDAGLTALQIDLQFSNFGDDVDIQVPDNAFDVMKSLSGLADKLPGS